MKTFLRKADAATLLYTTEFSWTRTSQKETFPRPDIQPSHASLSISDPPSAPCHFSPCVCPKKRTPVAPEGSTAHKPREGLCPGTHTDRLTRSEWRFHKLRGLALTQQRKSLCLGGITPIPIRKKGYRGEEVYSLVDQKKRPGENRDLCHDHLRKGRMLSTFFSPKLKRPLLWPSETRYTGTGSSAGIESFTPETPLRGSLPELSTPAHLHSHSKDVSVALEWL